MNVQYCICLWGLFRILANPWRIQISSGGPRGERSFGSEFCPGFLYLAPEKVRSWNTQLRREYGSEVMEYAQLRRVGQ